MGSVEGRGQAAARRPGMLGAAGEAAGVWGGSCQEDCGSSEAQGSLRGGHCSDAYLMDADHEASRTRPSGPLQHVEGSTGGSSQQCLCWAQSHGDSQKTQLQKREALKAALPGAAAPHSLHPTFAQRSPAPPTPPLPSAPRLPSTPPLPSAPGSPHPPLPSAPRLPSTPPCPALPCSPTPSHPTFALSPHPAPAQRSPAPPTPPLPSAPRLPHPAPAQRSPAPHPAPAQRSPAPPTPPLPSAPRLPPPRPCPALPAPPPAPAQRSPAPPTPPCPASPAPPPRPCPALPGSPHPAPAQRSPAPPPRPCPALPGSPPPRPCPALPGSPHPAPAQRSPAPHPAPAQRSPAPPTPPAQRSPAPSTPPLPSAPRLPPPCPCPVLPDSLHPAPAKSSPLVLPAASSGLQGLGHTFQAMAGPGRHSRGAEHLEWRQEGEAGRDLEQGLGSGPARGSVLSSCCPGIPGHFTFDLHFVSGVQEHKGSVLEAHSLGLGGSALTCG
ncbi:hypothetical protein H8959_019653 [Pygathrix nigripes]